MSTLDEMMGFDPSNLEIFNEPKQQSQTDERIYVTNPKLSKSDDGVYRSKVRLLFNPFDFKKSIVKTESYWIQDSDGGITVNSAIAHGDRNCPIFKGWKKMWYVGEDGSTERLESQDRARKIFQRTTKNWVLVQVMDDDNQPELVGQFKFWKIPMDIFKKLTVKMQPSPESKKMSEPLMDYLFGKILEIEVTPGPDDPKDATRKQREIKYTTSDFDTEVTPIMKTDCEPLFTEDEFTLIEEYADRKKKIAKLAVDKRSAALSKLASDEISGKIKLLYQKALDYLKIAPNVSDMEWKPWDESTKERVDRWLENILNGNDPTMKTTEPQMIFDTLGVDSGMGMMEDMSPVMRNEDEAPF